MGKYSNYISILMLLSCSQQLLAQIGNDFVGARIAALGGYSVTLFDVWSTHNNQAGLGFLEDVAVGINYENRFLLKETSYKAGAFVFPMKTSALGINIVSFGYSAYSETKAGLSYGKRFGKKLSVGVQLNYLHTSFNQEYGSKTTFTGAVGLIIKLSKELTLGVHIYNPSRTKLITYGNQRVPTIMKLGLDYRFSEKVMLAASTEKDMDVEAIVNVGVEYHIAELLYLRTGISTNPNQYAFGIGMQFKDVKVDMSSSFHQTLGATPSISIIYNRKKKLNNTATP